MTTEIRAIKTSDGLPVEVSVPDLYEIQYWDDTVDINGNTVTTMTSSKTVSLSDQRAQWSAIQQILGAINSTVMAAKLAGQKT